VAVTITFIRHAETTANAEHRWQGVTDAPLSPRGEEQVRRLSDRFSSNGNGGPLIASDLPRTMKTASALGDPIPDRGWREFDVGSWEGLTTEEVAERDPQRYQAMVAGEDVALGGGERMSEFRSRVAASFGSLVRSLGEGDEATVVTHGGVIWALIDHVVGNNGHRIPVTLAHNTAVTRIRVHADGSSSLVTFNDTTHLDEVPLRPGSDPRSVTLVRHGETLGNVAGRWQGRSDSALTDRGRWQVAQTASIAHAVDAVYTSPLGRAADSAAIIGEPRALVPQIQGGLVEMSFGSWENLTPAEAADNDPDLYDAIYGRGEDRPRGGDGESFTEAGERLASTLSSLAGSSDSAEVAAVSHGAVIRAFATRILGLTFADRHRLPVPRNSSMSRVTFYDGSPFVASYNVAPHLD
jgi:broad specificity phosphatase PhoE